MLLADYLLSKKDISWDYARQCGVKHAAMRLPEDGDFDITRRSHWLEIRDRFAAFGIKPVVIEPLPNSLHDHIKTGDGLRDQAIEKLIAAFAIMDELDIRILCFNFMAHIGWLRTEKSLPDRGGALVTGFDARNVRPDEFQIDEDAIWNNYFYFIKAVVGSAEKYGIRLALHPDDPPLEKIGRVCRVMTSLSNIERAVRSIDSGSLGVTLCHACYYLMREDLDDVVSRLRDKIFFVHFRNVVGVKECFRETFHDDGAIDMAEMIRIYRKNGVDVPVRVDHVPTMAGELAGVPGYNYVGRMFAIGYLKGLLDMAEKSC